MSVVVELVVVIYAHLMKSVFHHLSSSTVVVVVVVGVQLCFPKRSLHIPNINEDYKE